MKETNDENLGSILLEQSPNPIIIFKNDYSISYINKALENLTGYSLNEVAGTQPPHPWWTEEKKREYTESFKGDDWKGVYYKERIFVKKSGEPFWVSINSILVNNGVDKSRFRISIWTDITERKNLEARLLEYQKELRSLDSQLALDEQESRRQLSTKIHGGITQLLALCSIKLAVLTDSNIDSDTANQLTEIYKILQKAIEDSRSLTFELSPPSLYDLGLEAALEEIAEQFGRKQKIHIDFEDDGKRKTLDDGIKVILFRSVQELLNNINEHSQASRVKISMKKAGKEIQVTVSDDGKGFNSSRVFSHPKKNNEYGLFSIREHLRYFGGYLEIDSKPGAGTRVTLVAPLKAT